MKLVCQFVVASSCLFVSFSASARTARALKIIPLKDARTKLVLDPHTAKERQLVADQAALFLKNMYVHRELKITDFGVSSDALPRLADMQRQAATLPDDVFHESMQKIFLDLHDHHTNYTAAMPLACSYVVTPLIFKDVYENGALKIVVEGVSRLFKDATGDFENAKALDELVAVNGTPMATYLSDLKRESGGANNDAMIVSGLMNMSIRSLSEHPVPKENAVTYTLKGTNGNYDVKTDLFAIVNEPSCVSQNEEAGQGRGAKPSGLPRDMENPKTKVWRDLVAPEKQTSFSQDPLSEIAEVSDLRTPAGKLTYVQLFTFMPEKASVDQLIHRFKEVLSARQSDSQGLIIDVRGNGGGAIKLAEDMVQLFTVAQVAPMPVRLLPNELNQKMFMISNGGVENGWSADIVEAMAQGRAFTAPRVITSISEANRFGQIWFKPVVVLVDANCYSACDLFAAGMQDHSAATIIGIHAATGAGGANVMEYDSFRSVFEMSSEVNPFPKLPHGQSMRVSWRQTIRTGKNSGKLIEDAGITPDVVIRETKEDVGVGASRKLMASVRDYISSMGPQFQSSTRLASSVRIANDAVATWRESVKGVDQIEVKSNGTVLKTYRVSPGGEELEIRLDDVTGVWESKTFEVVGTLASKTKFRVVRELFWRGANVKLTAAGIDEDFTGAEPKYLRSVAMQGPDTGKWQLSHSVYRVGAGTRYGPSVRTEAFIPLDVESVRGKATLVIDFKLLSEDGMDIFSILSRDTETGIETYMYTLDGAIDTEGPVGLVIPNNGKQVEIVFEFESDENWHMSGPEIKSLAIRGKSAAEMRRLVNVPR